jgi:hypothetical protein
VRRRKPSADPISYRIDYSIAVQILHAVSEKRAREVPGRARQRREPTPKLRQVVDAARSSLLREDSALLQPDLEAARAESLRLILKSAAELERQRWRRPGRRPPWYLRRLRKARKRRLAEFLERVLEPAAVVLFWSCETEDDAMWEPGREPVALDRRSLLSAAEAEDERAVKAWLCAYLGDLLSSPVPQPTVPRRLWAWLGATRLRARSEPDPRVRYNLACLFSRRAARRFVVANEKPDRDLAEAARQLSLALSRSRGAQREALVRWAQEDPGLQGLRGGEGLPFLH